MRTKLADPQIVGGVALLLTFKYFFWYQLYNSVRGRFYEQDQYKKLQALQDHSFSLRHRTPHKKVTKDKDGNPIIPPKILHPSSHEPNTNTKHSGQKEKTVQADNETKTKITTYKDNDKDKIKDEDCTTSKENGKDCNDKKELKDKELKKVKKKTSTTNKEL